MKKTKIFFGEKRLKDVYVGASKIQVLKYRLNILFISLIRLTVLSIIGTMAVVIVYTLGAHNERIALTENTPVEVFENYVPPVMKRIALCESGNTHFDKSGQVLMRSNTNKSVDVGRYQINTVWNAKASELGLDLTNEKDNESFALWIYENRGTNDWNASYKCWR